VCSRDHERRTIYGCVTDRKERGEFLTGDHCQFCCQA
jgi:hypothetical protein